MADIRNILDKPPNSPTLEQKYELGFVLGKGAFGTVYLAKSKTNGATYACKSISKAKLVCAEDIEDVQREVQVLNLVSDHPHVAELIETFEDSNNVHVILELCKGGELFDRVVSKGTFTEKMAAEFFRTMVQVVHHCHQLGVMHRDIKPENFLLTDATDNAVLKAADFGLCTYFKPGERFTAIVGSAYYVAPEVLRRDYSYEADMWSLGVILYILLCGLPPFWGDAEEDIFKMILKGELDFHTKPWPSISAQAKDCVRRMLTLNPVHRATAKDILQHPWLKEQGVALDTPLDSVVSERIKQFAAMNKLKKAALLFIAKNMSADEITGLRQLFKSIDTDDSGTITAAELKNAMAKMGNKIGDDDLAKLMSAADVDGNGTIDYEEFVAATTNLNKLEKEECCLQAFKHFDLDNSGFISPEEVEIALASFGVSKEEVKEMIRQNDKNNDGQIDYQEFLAMMRGNNKDLQHASSFLRQLKVDPALLKAK